MERFYCSTFQCFIQHTRSHEHFLCLSFFYLILTLAHTLMDASWVRISPKHISNHQPSDQPMPRSTSSCSISWKLIICIWTTNSWNWCVTSRRGTQVKWSVWHVSSQLLEIGRLVRLEINLHVPCLKSWVIVCVCINYVNLLLWHRYFLL